MDRVTLKQLVKSIGIYIICAVFMVLAIRARQFGHVDEVFTYGLANHKFADTIDMQIKEGYKYVPAGEAWLEYMTVQPGERFNYANVWKNQSEDVHPILYYVLVHTISSFFPQKFSVWYAGIINVIFSLLTLCVVRRAVCRYTGSKITVLTASLFYIFSYGIWQAAAFRRMYVMTMFQVALITLLFVELFENKHTFKMYLFTFITSVLGILTHYYFVVYLCFLCLIYGIVMLTDRRFKELIRTAAAIISSCAVSVLIFPGIIAHVTKSDRGKQTLENLTGENIIAEYGANLKSYFSFVDESIFGGAFIYIVIFMICFVVISILATLLKRNARKSARPRKMKSLMIFMCPNICYFLLIAKISVGVTDRYIYPIYAVMIISLICLCFEVFNSFAGIAAGNALTGCIFLGVFIFSLYNYNLFQYLKPSYLGKINEEYKNYDCIYVYDRYEVWKVNASFAEVSNYRSVAFITGDSFDYVYSADVAEQEKLLVTITDTIDADFYMASIVGVCPKLNSYVQVASEGYATTYLAY